MAARAKEAGAAPRLGVGGPPAALAPYSLVAASGLSPLDIHQRQAPTARHGTARHRQPPARRGQPARARALPPSAAPGCCPEVLPPSAAPGCCPQVLSPSAAPGCCPGVLPPSAAPPNHTPPQPPQAGHHPAAAQPRSVGGGPGSAQARWEVVAGAADAGGRCHRAEAPSKVLPPFICPLSKLWLGRVGGALAGRPRTASVHSFSELSARPLVPAVKAAHHASPCRSIPPISSAWCCCAHRAVLPVRLGSSSSQAGHAGWCSRWMCSKARQRQQW